MILLGYRRRQKPPGPKKAAAAADPARPLRRQKSVKGFSIAKFGLCQEHPAGKIEIQNRFQ